MRLKQLFFTLVMALMYIGVFAQGDIRGVILDADSDNPLIAATVTIDGTNYASITNADGSFVIFNVPAGTHNLRISYLGYQDYILPVDIDLGEVDMGMIGLLVNAIGLEEVNIIANTAIDRKTPVAVSTIKSAEIENLVGNQEFPEILRKTPSVYVTKQGGGFGDSRINVRGFNQRNLAVMINGVPVNDMENGWVYWSNWAGLSDVSSTVQIQRGLGATRLAVPTAGGSVNIITNATQIERGGKAGVSFGNDGYYKANLMYSTGVTKKGWAFTLQGSRTAGDGYVDGTKFSAWSYFASVAKRFNDKHTITFTGLGAPQWHHQRTFSVQYDNITLATYEEKGIRFNHNWGTLDGKEFSMRRNFYHKPKVFINHYWNINEKSELKTTAYISFGNGGGTGPRGRLKTPNGSIYDSFAGFGKGIHNDNGQIRFDDLKKYNQGEVVSDWGSAKELSDGQYVVSSNGTIGSTNAGSGFIRRASMNNHSWYGVLSTFSTDFNDAWDWSVGIDGRYYVGKHYRRINDLLGADAYLSTSDVNNPSNLISTEGKADGNYLNYSNDGQVAWTGLFTTLEYSKNDFTWYATFSGASINNKRVDYFKYLDNDEKRATPWINSFSGVAKTGANYNFGNNNVYLNVGAISRQPIFDDVFLPYANDVAYGVRNQRINSIELGYGYRSNFIDARVDFYNTFWGNRSLNQSRTVQVVDGTDTLIVEGSAVFKNISQNHMGVELESTIRPIKYIDIKLMASVGDWEYGSNFTADIYDDNLNKIGDAVLYGDGLKVGDAAQTTISAGITIKPVKRLNIYLDYTWFDRLYAQFNLDETQFQQPDGQVAKLDSYGLMDLGANYRFNIAGNYGATFRFNVNNVLNTKYVSDMYTNIIDDPTTTEVNEFLNNKGYYGLGLTWNAGLTFEF